MENKPICEIDKYGNKYWFLNDLYHREDGPAIEYSDGTKKWFINGKQHRLDGPAIELISGTKYWYLNNRLHGLDGPAWIHNNGQSDWFINDYYVTKEIYSWATENNIDLDNLTDIDKALIKLIWVDYGK